MWTYRLWLEPDPEIPRFQRLRFAKVEVSVAEVLLEGIHPWQGERACPSLKNKLLEELNADDLRPAELKDQNYCADLSDPTPPHAYYDSRISQFEAMLSELRDKVCFVESLTYRELLAIAKERVRRRWTLQMAYTFLNGTSSGFESMRTFLKKKNPEVKISSYEDFNSYPLNKILSPEDFEPEDVIFIQHGIPTANFRSAAYLRRVTDTRGLLKLTDGIRHFHLTYEGLNGKSTVTVPYNAERSGRNIRMRPVLSREEAIRRAARDFASRWRTGNGRYCFQTRIEQLERMLERDQCGITFPNLSYTEPCTGEVSQAPVAVHRARRYAVGRHLTSSDPGEAIRSVLRRFNVSMTGRKEELLDKLAGVAAREYEKALPLLSAFFSEHRFIRVERGIGSEDFSVLEGADLRELVLSMFILKHLRGNVILDAKHENDTYDADALARTLVRREVSLDGAFVRVE